MGHLSAARGVFNGCLIRSTGNSYISYLGLHCMVQCCSSSSSSCIVCSNECSVHYGVDTAAGYVLATQEAAALADSWRAISPPQHIPDVIDVLVRSDAEPIPCPFFCRAAAFILSIASIFAFAL